MLKMSHHHAVPCILAGLLFALSACSGTDDGEQFAVDTLSTETPAADTSRTIYDIFQEEGRFSRFAAAVDSAGLEQTLSGPGPFTVFAPTDDAFRSVAEDSNELLAPENRDRLRGMLLYHISSGNKRVGDLQAGASIRSLEGRDLNVSGSGDSLQVGGAQVTETNIRASNGVVHVIGEVLRPESDEDNV